MKKWEDIENNFHSSTFMVGNQFHNSKNQMFQENRSFLAQKILENMKNDSSTFMVGNQRDNSKGEKRKWRKMYDQTKKKEK